MRAVRMTPLAMLALAGCGATVSVPSISSVSSVPSRPSVPSFHGAGDTADFYFDPEHVVLTQSGRVRADYGEPALRYSGPLGCRGRAFAGDVTDNIQFLFRYGSRDAWLGWDNGDVWHFTRPPKIGPGTVTFAQRFSDGRRMRVVVHCPPPPRGGRL
jgi:hypothetical protein